MWKRFLISYYTPASHTKTRHEGSSLINVRFEVSTAVTMKNAVLWYVTPCVSCNNRRFGGTNRLYHQDGKNQRARNNVSSQRALATANVPSSLIISTLMMEEIRSSETSV
jgi:hypothetical protein